MMNVMNLEDERRCWDLARILFEYHEKDFDSTKDVENKWKQLPMNRSWGDPYSMTKTEYFEMAKGAISNIEFLYDE